MTELHFKALKEKINSNINYIRSEKKFFAGIGKFEDFEDTIATTYYAIRTIFGCEPNEAITSITDGPGDNSIDAIYLDQCDEFVYDIYIIQTKHKKEYKQAFTKNEVHSFIKKFEDLMDGNPFEVMNNRLSKKWEEVKEICNNSEYQFKFLFITNGIVPNDDIQEPTKGISQEYEFIGLDKLLATGQMQRKSKPVEVSFRTSSRSILEEAQANITAVVCSIPVNQLIKIYENGGNEKILDRNIRFYLGKKNPINKQIIKTALNEEGERAEFFWFQNNGISIVCDILTSKKNPDGYYDIKLLNPLIVNGGQTTKTLYLLHNEKKDANFPDMQVMLRIFQTNDIDVINKITRSTNSQSPITWKDLEANNEIQELAKTALIGKKIYIETKRNEYDKREFSNVDKKNIIKNDTLIQYYVSIFEGAPSSAKANKTKCFQDNFNTIFNINNTDLIEKLEKTYLIYNYIINKERGMTGTFIKHANLALAFIISKRIDVKNTEAEKISDNIIKEYEEACKLLERIIDSEAERLGNAFSFNKMFKSSDLEVMINKNI